jgi:hypothetical protein
VVGAFLDNSVRVSGRPNDGRLDDIWCSPADARAGSAGENDAELTATPGNKIGYTVQKCPLKPPPFGSTEEIFIGYGPRHSHGDETKVDLIGVRDGKVTEWKELLLPDFQGWLTHYVWECKGRTFQVLDNFKVNQRFRWTGTHFEKIATATKRK